ncbi:MAG: hypothetical protein Q4G05_01755 [Clostridia bacterium]|nr:hypothetical protein [Clostridia bacterium]
MNEIDKSYLKKEKRLKKYYASKLLCELIELNFEYSNKEYNNINGDSIYMILEKSMKFQEKEKQEVIKTATILANLKYKINIIDYNNLIIEKEQ